MIHYILSVSPEFTTNRNHSFLMFYLYAINFIGVDKLGALRGKYVIRGQVNNAAHVMFTFNSVIILRLSPLCYRLLTSVLLFAREEVFSRLDGFVCLCGEKYDKSGRYGILQRNRASARRQSSSSNNNNKKNTRNYKTINNSP